MSQPALPNLAAATAALYRLQVRRLVRGKKLRLAVVVIALVVGAVLAARYAQSAVQPEDVVEKGTSLGFFTMLVYLVPFLLTSGAIAEEVEARTLTYLFSRPVGRLGLTLGKYLAGVSLAGGALVAGLLILHIGAYLTAPTLMVDEVSTTLRAMGSIVLLTLLYGAICMFWGAIAPEAAGIVSFLYLAVIEFAFGLLPGIFRFVSMNYHATQLAGLPKGGLRPDLVSDIGPTWPLVATIVMTLVFLGLAAVTVSLSEYRFGRA